MCFGVFVRCPQDDIVVRGGAIDPFLRQRGQVPTLPRAGLAGLKEHRALHRC